VNRLDPTPLELEFEQWLQCAYENQRGGLAEAKAPNQERRQGANGSPAVHTASSEEGDAAS